MQLFVLFSVNFFDPYLSRSHPNPLGLKKEFSMKLLLYVEKLNVIK